MSFRIVNKEKIIVNLNECADIEDPLSYIQPKEIVLKDTKLKDSTRTEIPKIISTIQSFEHLPIAKEAKEEKPLLTTTTKDTQKTMERSNSFSIPKRSPLRTESNRSSIRSRSRRSSRSLQRSSSHRYSPRRSRSRSRHRRSPSPYRSSRRHSPRRSRSRPRNRSRSPIQRYPRHSRSPGRRQNSHNCSRSRERRYSSSAKSFDTRNSSKRSNSRYRSPRRHQRYEQSPKRVLVRKSPVRNNVAYDRSVDRRPSVRPIARTSSNFNESQPSVFGRATVTARVQGPFASESTVRSVPTIMSAKSMETGEESSQLTTLSLPKIKKVKQVEDDGSSTSSFDVPLKRRKTAKRDYDGVESEGKVEVEAEDMVVDERDDDGEADAMSVDDTQGEVQTTIIGIVPTVEEEVEEFVDPLASIPDDVSISSIASNITYADYSSVFTADELADFSSFLDDKPHFSRDFSTYKPNKSLACSIPLKFYSKPSKRTKLLYFTRSAIHDWGLFANESVHPNETIIEYLGEIVRPIVAEVRELRYQKVGINSSYLFRVDAFAVIDATFTGNMARFMNHSCEPNCYAKIVEGRIVIYAKKEIRAGEELTYDYKFPEEEEKVFCRCGSKNCRGFLN